MTDAPIEMQQYFEALFREKERALEMASNEREKAAIALRDTQQRAAVTAEAEREKAAAALRAGTDRAIRDNYERLSEAVASTERLIVSASETMSARVTAGDKALHDHIDAQFSQVGLIIESLRREQGILFETSQAAILKAEGATEKRFASVNEFREQLSDQAARFLPREVAEAQFKELEKACQSNTDRLNKYQGRDAAVDRRQDRQQPWQLWIAGGVMSLIFIIITIILSNVLTGSGA